MINAENYLNAFRKAASQLDSKRLKEMEIEAAVVEVLGCVVLKLYKKCWANRGEDPLKAKSRIFFSVWADDSTMHEQKIQYNIHAFKLRHLEGYAIESNKFAAIFRVAFKPFEPQWPNVSVKFGPLTLMEGRLKIDPENLGDEILGLANHFLEIAPLIDQTLAKFKR